MEEEEGGEENFVGEDDEVGEEDGVEDGEKDDEDEGTDEDSTQQVNAEDVTLQFIDCIVQGEQKADRNVVLSCLESALHALRQWFPMCLRSLSRDPCVQDHCPESHVSKIIVQSPMYLRSLSRVPCVQDHCPESHVSKIIVQSDNATNLTGKQLSCS